jgi:hypothetical protein
MRPRRSVVAAAMGCALLSVAVGGCGAKTYYDWGSYEQSVQHLYSPKSEATVIQDRQKLMEEVHKTETDGKKVPPGKYAQIGYLCYLTGDKIAAASYFGSEKKAYPESAKLMNDMIARLR